MEYQLVQLEKDEFKEVWEIMEESFPVDERRSREGQEAVLDEEAYALYGCRAQGRLAAFFAVWQFDKFSFIEHFAVEKSCRNLGLGAGLLQQVLKKLKNPVVLEVEPPEAELPRRRIAFYERNGFLLNEYPYVQPKMSAEGKAIPLMIMSASGKLTKTEFEEIKAELYRCVYKSKL